MRFFVSLRNQLEIGNFSRLEGPADDLQISEVSQFGAGGP